ncbi:MAG: hypothetical protein VX918_10070 [Chloroflexota bacterium]|jgi:hypothetical protein|nr:hypothetical protein [Chloroflexota bacterium]
MKQIAYFSIAICLSVVVSSCVGTSATKPASMVEDKTAEKLEPEQMVRRITPNPGKSATPTPKAISRVLPDYSGLNDPQVEEQFLSFQTQLDYLSSNPKSLDEWIELISLGNSSFILPELPDCWGSKVRKCFDELMPLVGRYQFGPGGSFATGIPPSDACTIMNYTYGIVKIYGEPQSAGYPEINSNFATMVRYNFINEDELVNFRGAFTHRNHWDYLVHCQTPRATSRVLPDYSGLNDPHVEEQFLSFQTQLDYLSSNPKSLDEWIELISLDNSSFILPELPNCRGSKVRKCFDELMPLVERYGYIDFGASGSFATEIPHSDACTIMNYAYGVVKIYGEPLSDEHPEINSNFATMVRYKFINEDELSNFRWAFHHRNHWDYSEYCL